MTGGIAIVKDNSLIGEVRMNVKIAHSERLMGSVDWLLKTSDVPINEITAFAISIGPGSFTGLRIGLCTVKGLAYATYKPVIPVPTLDAFARSLPLCAYPLCPMLDARKNEVYTGLYKWEANECVKLIPERAVNPSDFLKELKGPTVFAGDGAVTYRDLIKDELKGNALFAPASRMYPSAATVAEIAIEKIRSGFIADPVTITPFYIRKSEAEIHLKNNLKE
jgi:tRNA threonylcarbamoyladenosine biosynthesis protein TsaB